MRLLVILSPTDRWGTKTEYTRLRKFLHKDGYLRIAPEVYMRIVQNRKASEKHYRRIEEYTPKTGIVRLLRLTEKQYNNIYLVTGEADYQEKAVGTIIRKKQLAQTVILCYNKTCNRLIIYIGEVNKTLY